MKQYFNLGFILLFLMSCIDEKEKDPLQEILGSFPPDYEKVISDHEKYGVQILYTQIDRDKENQPHLSTWSCNVDSMTYFYPASTIKLPIALLALEKINKINISGLKSSSFMITDSAYSIHDIKNKRMNPKL